MAKRFLNVFFYGKKVGVLTETPSSSLRFTYDENATEAISVRLPIRKETYPNSYAKPFFENLTPEAEIKTLIAKKIGISENNTFSLLDKLGGDCAGAISLYQDDKIPSKDKNLVEITDTELVKIIENLPSTPAGENDRISLPGAQPKFAMVYKDGKYYHSNDMFPSTHIVKVENKNYKYLLENEYFCMKLAKILNMDVPDVELKEVNGLKYLLIERYDRVIHDDRIERIHQEDFCQILGVLSEKKYQQNGGPSIKNCYKAIQDYISKPALNAKKFLEIIMYNYLIGNNDAHAKNFSILHFKNKEIRISSFYDLLSTELYPNLSRNLAMKIGNQQVSDKLHLTDFKLLAKELNIKENIFPEMLTSRYSNISKLANELAVSCNKSELTKSPIYDEIVKLITERYNKLIKETI